MAARVSSCLALVGCAIGLAVAAPVAFGSSRQTTLPGSAAAGKKVFVAFCGKCHTMAAAGSNGTLGPNLDQDRVSFSEVVTAIEEGVGGIQAEYVLRDVTFSQIYNVANFVATDRRGQTLGGTQGSP
jgi:mono/diheme cytochrome c family protein